MSKLVVLDLVTEITYVINYDKSVLDSAMECISAANEELGLDISLVNCHYMTVNEFNLKIL